LSALAKDSVDVLIPSRVDDPTTLAALASGDVYDLIICADVLEHLAEPAPVLVALAGLLSPGGRLITSLPNVRHVSTFISLGILGTWPARSRGIHDRTHLRFFARPDILRLGEEARLECMREKRNLRLIESAPWTTPLGKLLDFWPLRSFFTFQYLHLWRRDESPEN
jgi:SAM-dependent methyltransferase